MRSTLPQGDVETRENAKTLMLIGRRSSVNRCVCLQFQLLQIISFTTPPAGKIRHTTQNPGAQHYLSLPTRLVREGAVEVAEEAVVPDAPESVTRQPHPQHGGEAGAQTEGPDPTE